MLLGSGPSRLADQKRPLDYRYGPWNSLASAYNNLYFLEDGDDFVYYGMTIGIKVFDEENVQVGVDEYWWQPRCVENPDYDPSDPESDRYIDGFIRKYPANVPSCIQKDNSSKVLGISQEDTVFSAAWVDDQSGASWNDLTPESIEDVDSEEP
jgi:hypothetical protein